MNGVKMTATIHDRTSEMAITWNSEITYSLAVAFDMAIGRKPATVISVPTSIGTAVTP
jgi:hypothetical protein